MGLGLQHHVHSQAEFQRFLIMLKTEMIQAGYGLDTYHQGLIRNNREIKLKKDANLDQDLLNSGEQLVYQFFPEQKKLSRKSGQGYFQTLIKPLNYLDSLSVSTSTEMTNHAACVKIRYQFEKTDRSLKPSYALLNYRRTS